MSSPSPPKPKKINPYQGVTSDVRINDARLALGIDKIKKDGHMRKINQYIFDEDVAHYQKDSEFVKATNQLVMEGIIDADINRYSDKKSFNKWAKNKFGDDDKRKAHYESRMVKQYGDDWYATSGIEGAQINAQNLVDIQSRQEENYYSDQSADQQAQLEEFYNKQTKDSEKAAKKQEELMKEMMNQPVYMPKQQQNPVVQKPQVMNDPIMPAPAPNTPMSIGAPPAPELTNTGQRMAIVRTPKSTQSRSRRATRGTSSLTN